MQRMSEEELREIISDRLSRINFEVSAGVERKIVQLSQGLPGYVHLLGQMALRNAIDRRSRAIEGQDFRSALAQALEKADFQTRNDYYKAVSSAAKDNKYKEVLLACALAESNELGYFFAGSLREPYSRIRGRSMDIPNYATNLNNLCSEERGPALIKTGKPKRFQYRFNNPLLQPLTIMMGVNEELITLD
jgi:hypothetical protein